MAMKIDQKIKGYSVVSAEDKAKAAVQAETAVSDAAQALDRDRAGRDNVVQMHEKIERPETLIGSTYKLKTPLFEHALYVTINDIVLNAGSEHEHRRPFEIFINSKNMDHFQWIVALTRIMSAVFRKGGDVTFLVEEMKAVFDPRGGYFKAGGVYMPSLVAELGSIVEEHLKSIGMIQDPEMSDAQREMIAGKYGALYRSPFSGTQDLRHPPQRGCRGHRRWRGGVSPLGIDVPQVQHQGDRHHGRLRDVPQLRVFQVRLTCRRRG